jgi:phage I-like protein
MTNQEGAVTLPDWLRVLPLGRVELVDRREPLEVDTASLRAMVAAFRSRGVDLVIDYEHQSLQGERAPAAGWIKELEAREDGLWARVEWTPQAREYLLSKEYRYFSPVLRLDPETRKPLSLMHLGLTNLPAINQLPPLVAKYGDQPEAARPRLAARVLERGDKEEEGEAMEELKSRLGLDSGAEEAAAWRQVLEVFRDLAATLDLPGEATVSQLKGAVAGLKAGADRLLQAQEEVQVLKSRMAEESATRVVAEALKAGKVTPAQRSWALEYYRQDPEGFQAYVARAPRLVPAGEELRLLGDDPGGQGDLLPEEMAICRALNLSPQAYWQAKMQQTELKFAGTC